VRGVYVVGVPTANERDHEMSEYYGRDGEPMTPDEWLEKFSDFDYKRVALDKIGDVEVSTVWLGLNHNWGAGRPLIFETLTFGGPDDGDMDRYATEAEALRGHEQTVSRLKA
jgi:hypothetical protein